MKVSWDDDIPNMEKIVSKPPTRYNSNDYVPLILIFRQMTIVKHGKLMEDEVAHHNYDKALILGTGFKIDVPLIWNKYS